MGKKIEELGAKLHFEILNGDRDVKDLLEDKLQDDKDELQGEIEDVQDKSTGKFTAGKSGVYQVSVSAEVGVTYDDEYFQVFLRTSSGNYQDGYEAYIARQQAGGKSHLYTPQNAIRFISL